MIIELHQETMSKVRLERVYKPNPGFVPIVVVDLRVHLCNILSKYEEAEFKCKGDTEKLNTWVKACWAKLLNYPLPFMSHRSCRGYRLIIVDDTKADLPNGHNYWRNEECVRLGLEQYKGNRGGDSCKPEEYWKIYRSATDYFLGDGSDIGIFKEFSMEADDMAGMVHRTVNELAEDQLHGFSCDAKGRDVFYWTIDGDWQQLVDDKTSQLFHGTLGGQGLMSESEVLGFYMRKGTPITSPKEIARMKSITGDLGDNLFPGSPISLFDLLDPPVKPSKTLKDLVRLELSKDSSNVSKEHYQSALRWLSTNRLPCV